MPLDLDNLIGNPQKIATSLRAPRLNRLNTETPDRGGPDDDEIREPPTIRNRCQREYLRRPEGGQDRERPEEESGKKVICIYPAPGDGRR